MYAMTHLHGSPRRFAPRDDGLIQTFPSPARPNAFPNHGLRTLIPAPTRAEHFYRLLARSSPVWARPFVE